VEIFAIPGFGVAGVLGIIFIVTGLTLSMVGNVGFHFPEGSFNGLMASFFIVVIAAFLSIVISFYLSRQILTKHTFGHLALETVQDSKEGYTSADIAYLGMIGKQGIARTILRPVGKVTIDEEVYDATAIISYIEKGAAIEVVKYETGQLFVRRI